MKFHTLCVVACAGLLTVILWPDRTEAAQPLCLLPQPVDVKPNEGRHLITPSTQVVAGDARSAAEAQKLIKMLAPALGFRLRLVDATERPTHVIALTLDNSLPQQLGTEGYQLKVTPRRIDLRAAAPAGLFYACQTLRQLLPTDIFAPTAVKQVPWAVPCVQITDYPRFAWRGLLIDPARHFIPVEDVKRFINTMALHKLNRLQMHLSDNIGWRLQIKKYPDLTRLASDRDRSGDKGGFYTQQQVRELVQYAAQRYVTIVPEIEMPFHAGAAINAYPALGIAPERVAGMTIDARWGKLGGLVAPRPETVSFMQDVLREVIELFPSPFIHIGGDEANLALWANDPEIQALMQQLECRDTHQLHSWFIRQMDTFLAAHGRRLVGWDEILQGGLAPGATVMSWRGMEGGIAAARAGHDVIMAPTSHTYFDYRQAPDEKGLGNKVLSLEQVCTFEPVPSELTGEQAQHILGGQGQLWGELIPSAERREFMAWPRACALSEILWSSKSQRTVDLLLVRLEQHLQRLAAAKVNYRPLDQRPKRWEGQEDSGGPEAAAALLRRLLPEHAEQFAFETIAPEKGRDVFEIQSLGGKIVIRGNTGVSLARGLNWYLKHYCRCHVSWCGNQLYVPDPLPSVDVRVRRVAWARHRYFLNYCCFGYSLAFWDWSQWQQLIDWMALNGVNMPLSVTGQEAVWETVCRRLGMSQEQIEAFLAGPPYLPFQWMGCLDSWGGPLPKQWVERHAELQRKILARQRELGMTPVLQGFTGHVPAALRQSHPDAKLHTINWIEWETHLLDPLDPLFAKIAAIWIDEQTRLFGTDHYYAADTFIEMTPPSGEEEYLGNLSRAIYDGMAQSDPQAVWVLQGWAFMFQRGFWTLPRIEAFLDAVPDDRVRVLDLMCEARPMWNETRAFCGKPWLWCNIQDWGGNVFLGGALNKIVTDLPAARRDPNHGNLVGLGFVNEGLGYNPVVYDLLYELAWRDEAIELDSWLADFTRCRYGADSADAQRAWKLLGETVYTAPHHTRSIIDHTPTLSAKPGSVPYDNEMLADAWHCLLNASHEVADRDTYLFDVVNVGRQVLVNHASVLHHEIVKAHQAQDAGAFDAATARFLQLLRDIDQLLATRQEFLLGRWISDARRWGITDEDCQQLEWNARRVVTLWGETTRIDDYARKDWSGMIGGYYLDRWQRFLAQAAQSIKADQPFDAELVHARLRKWMVTWSDNSNPYSTTPRGDSLAVARELWEKYGDAFGPDAISLTTGKPATCSHAIAGHSAHLANDGRASNTDRYWATDVKLNGEPAWWQADLRRPEQVGRVVIVGYYGDQRHYGFTVETSLDGASWNLAADLRDNREQCGPGGYNVEFSQRLVRYLRINQTGNSANSGRHLVEVMAYER